MYEYEVFGNKNPKISSCEQCLRRDIALLCCGVVEGGPFWPFGLTAARQPFAAVKDYAAARVPFATAKGSVFAQIFSLLLFAIFSKNPQKPLN